MQRSAKIALRPRLDPGDSVSPGDSDAALVVDSGFLEASVE